MTPIVPAELRSQAGSWSELHPWERSELGKALRLSWVRAFHESRAEFVLALHLHAGNDERAAKRYWREALDLPGAPFHKTHIKAAGTGHRKNSLPHGVCRVLMRRSTDAWIRTLSWVHVLASEFA